MDFERAGRNADDDETAVNLRAYFDRMGPVKLAEYDPSWSVEQLMAWDDNFKDDGDLFLPCSVSVRPSPWFPDPSESGSL